MLVTNKEHIEGIYKPMLSSQGSMGIYKGGLHIHIGKYLRSENISSHVQISTIFKIREMEDILLEMLNSRSENIGLTS